MLFLEQKGMYKENFSYLPKLTTPFNLKIFTVWYSFWDDISLASLPQAERFAYAMIEARLKFYWSASVAVDLFGHTKHAFERRV